MQFWREAWRERWVQVVAVAVVAVVVALMLTGGPDFGGSDDAERVRTEGGSTTTEATDPATTDTRATLPDPVSTVVITTPPTTAGPSTTPTIVTSTTARPRTTTPTTARPGTTAVPAPRPTTTAPTTAPTTEAPPTTAAPPTTTPGTTAPSVVDVEVFWVAAGRLVPVMRQVAVAEAATTALRALLAGPTEAEQAAGYSSQVPPGTRLLAVTLQGGVAQVDLSGEFANPDSGEETVLRIAQVVCTVDPFEGVEAVTLAVDGRLLTSLNGVELSRPVTCADFGALR